MITESMYHFLKTMEEAPILEVSLTQRQIDLRDAALSSGYISMTVNEKNQLCYTMNPSARMEILAFEDVLNNTAEQKREKALEKHSDRRFDVILVLLSFVLGMITENWTGFIQLIVDAIHSVTP